MSPELAPEPQLMREAVVTLRKNRWRILEIAELFDRTAAEILRIIQEENQALQELTDGTPP